MESQTSMHVDDRSKESNTNKRETNFSMKSSVSLMMDIVKCPPLQQAWLVPTSKIIITADSIANNGDALWCDEEIYLHAYSICDSIESKTITSCIYMAEYGLYWQWNPLAWMSTDIDAIMQCYQCQWDIKMCTENSIISCALPFHFAQLNFSGRQNVDRFYLFLLCFSFIGISFIFMWHTACTTWTTTW